MTYGLDDQSAYGQVFYARQLSDVSGVDLNGFVDWYKSGVSGGSHIWSEGATASYYHNTGGALGDALSAQALISARYTF